MQCDLHTHSVFSDGSVWPDIRVEEALREGLDLIAITEHLEYQPHKKDIPHPDRNRSFELAQNTAKNQNKLRVVNGAEITRNMPPGHINAVFLKDANKLLHKDSLSGIEAANKQNAFVFWNHPAWDAQRADGIARLEPFHRYLIDKQLLHGIEVVNERTFSEEAFQLALDNELTLLGTSDIHGLTDWLFDIPNGGHRPTTFALCDTQDTPAIKQALFQGRTIVWYEDLLLGKEENIRPVLAANFTAHWIGYEPNKTLARVQLVNKSALPLNLTYKGSYSFYKRAHTLILPAYESIELLVKTNEKRNEIRLDFVVNNVLIGPKQGTPIAFIFSPE